MIEAAAIISAFLQNWDDLVIITALLVVNVIVRSWQENKASNAIELLKQKLALRAKVLRDGKWADLPAKELVPGDIVRLRLGNIVPADTKLVDGAYLQIDESALTGESLPVEKHPGDVAYSSSIVRQGEMNALVVTTGMNTYFGRTTKLVEEAHTKSHFQGAVVKIGDYLIALAAAMVTVTSIVGLLRHQAPLEILQFGLVLIVAAIPAAMPTVLSVCMTVGASALAKKEAIVSKLVAIDEMAGVDILCADKTGTITKNELTVGEVKTFKEIHGERRPAVRDPRLEGGRQGSDRRRDHNESQDPGRDARLDIELQGRLLQAVRPRLKADRGHGGRQGRPGLSGHKGSTSGGLVSRPRQRRRGSRERGCQRLRRKGISRPGCGQDRRRRRRGSGSGS